MTPSALLQAALRRHQLERSAGIIAVSGGPDSVALRLTSPPNSSRMGLSTGWYWRMLIISFAASKVMTTNASCMHSCRLALR